MPGRHIARVAAAADQDLLLACRQVEHGDLRVVGPAPPVVMVKSTAWPPGKTWGDR